MDVDCKQDNRFAVKMYSKLLLPVDEHTTFGPDDVQIVPDYTMPNKVKVEVVLDYSKYWQQLQLNMKYILRHGKQVGPGVLLHRELIQFWEGQTSNGASRETMNGEVYEICPIEYKF